MMSRWITITIPMQIFLLRCCRIPNPCIVAGWVRSAGKNTNLMKAPFRRRVGPIRHRVTTLSLVWKCSVSLRHQRNRLPFLLDNHPQRLRNLP